MFGEIRRLLGILLFYVVQSDCCPHLRGNRHRRRHGGDDDGDRDRGHDTGTDDGGRDHDHDRNGHRRVVAAPCCRWHTRHALRNLCKVGNSKTVDLVETVLPPQLLGTTETEGCVLEWDGSDDRGRQPTACLDSKGMKNLMIKAVSKCPFLLKLGTSFRRSF
jgi:hypothetical protein